MFEYSLGSSNVFAKSPVLFADGKNSDQTTAAQSWYQDLAPSPGFTPADQDPNFFSSAHGLVQTHPAGFGVQADDPASRPYIPASSLDFDTRGLNELRYT